MVINGRLRIDWSTDVIFGGPDFLLITFRRLKGKSETKACESVKCGDCYIRRAGRG